MLSLLQPPFATVNQAPKGLPLSLQQSLQIIALSNYLCVSQVSTSAVHTSHDYHTCMQHEINQEDNPQGISNKMM